MSRVRFARPEPPLPARVRLARWIDRHEWLTGWLVALLALLAMGCQVSPATKLRGDFALVSQTDDGSAVWRACDGPHAIYVLREMRKANALFVLPNGCAK